jgi:uncharacterized membrane protein
VTDAQPANRPVALAISLIVAGVIGWYAAFVLTLEKLHALANPGAAAGCDFSVLVQCSRNLESWQGSLFGFPNPILGLTGWMAPVVVGAAILAGARFARWFWIVFNLGVAFAMALVIFLIYTSIFVLGTLCPWCMLTWTVTIPTFLLVTVHNLRSGVIPLPPRWRERAESAYGWVPVVAIICYLIVAVLAQVQLDVLNHL